MQPIKSSCDDGDDAGAIHGGDGASHDAGDANHDGDANDDDGASGGDGDDGANERTS